jgi:hypothetical protein
VQLRSLRHASTQEDGQTIRWKHAPAAGKRQIHTRISRSESGRHALPCVYSLRTHFAHASPLAYCCPYACVLTQVETQPKRNLPVGFPCRYVPVRYELNFQILLRRISYVKSFPLVGRFEYFHRSPASRRRRRKGNPVPGGITGPLCAWGI